MVRYSWGLGIHGLMGSRYLSLAAVPGDAAMHRAQLCSRFLKRCTLGRFAEQSDTQL